MEILKGSLRIYKWYAMNPNVTQEIREVLEAVHYRPAVSVILPFEPKMSLKRELTQSLKSAANKVERGIIGKLPGSVGYAGDAETKDYN
jgi:hypothetical protein